MDKYVVSHYMSTKHTYNYRTKNEFSIDTYANSKVIFRGSKSDCIKFCKIQILDCATKLIDLDLDDVEYELRTDSLYDYEACIHIYGYTDAKKGKNFLYYHSTYCVEKFKSWMND